MFISLIYKSLFSPQIIFVNQGLDQDRDLGNNINDNAFGEGI